MRIIRFSAFAVLAGLSVLSFAVRAEEIRGRVVRVSDGDTITVLDAGHTQHKVRLAKIDAPEKAQPFGTAARLHLAGMVTNGPVRVSFEGRDRYGRIIGIVFAGELECNLRMVADGYAWHYKHFDKSPAYANAEQTAQTNKRGLWKDSAPIPPWNWRREHKKGKNRTPRP